MTDVTVRSLKAVRWRKLAGGALIATSLLLLAAPDGIAPRPALSVAGVAVGFLEVAQ